MVDNDIIYIYIYNLQSGCIYLETYTYYNVNVLGFNCDPFHFGYIGKQNFIIYKPFLGSHVVPHKIWAQ